MSQTEVQLIKDSAVVTADIADQAVTLDKLPHGTGSNDGKFLRANNGADPTFETVTSTTINTNADNRVITGSGTANTLNGESGLTYDGSNLSVTGGLDVSSDVSIADVIKHTGDTNTKIRFPAADTVSIETSGNERLRVDSSGRVMIGTTTEGNGDGDEFTIANVSGANMGMTIRSGTGALGNIFFSDATSGNAEFAGFLQYGHNDNSLRFGTNETTRMKIDSTGRISAGKHGLGSHNDASEYLKVQSDDTSANISIVGSNDTHSSLNMGDEDDFNIQKIKSDHTDNSLQFFTNDSQRLRILSNGRVHITPSNTNYTMNSNSTNLIIGSGGGAVGMTFLTAGAADGQFISFQANETLSRAEGEISYGPPTTSTTADRNNMMFRVNSSEKLRILAGGGIVFNGDTPTAANALDDYEEGTWTPVFGNLESAPTYSTQYGRYCKTGSLVQLTGQITANGGGLNSDGSAVNISGLPFTGNSSAEACLFTFGRYTDLLPQGELDSFTNVRFGGNFVMLHEGSNSDISYAECNTSGTIQFHIAYIMNS